MVKVERSVAIARSSDDVFAFVADQTNAARWQSGILEVRRLTDGPPGVGTRHVFTRTLMGRRMTGESEYVEFVPGRRVAFRTTSGPGLLASYDVAPVSTGTRLTAKIELDVSGVMTVAAPLVARSLSRDVEANLGRLKDILEDPANQAAAGALERGHATGSALVAEGTGGRKPEAAEPEARRENVESAR